jgi:hypothetical protein
MSSLELGRILYDTLFGLAPNVQPLFKRPRDAIAIKCDRLPCTASSTQFLPVSGVPSVPQILDLPGYKVQATGYKSRATAWDLCPQISSQTLDSRSRHNLLPTPPGCRPHPS